MFPLQFGVDGVQAGHLVTDFKLERKFQVEEKPHVEMRTSLTLKNSCYNSTKGIR